jgi:hypothetical protein
MADHIWSVLCESSIIDKESNNISLQTVREQITVHSEPIPGGIVPVHMELVSFWCRSIPDEPAVDNARLTLLKPSGEPISTTNIVINLTEADRSRNRIIFDGFPAEEPGRYIFLVEQSVNNDWKQVARVPFSVYFKPREREIETGAQPTEV